MLADLLRPPSAIDLEPTAYKDWLHLCVFDHPSATVGLVNVSLQGPPAEARSRATGLGLFQRPGEPWFGNLEVDGGREVAVGASSIGLRQVGLAVDPRTGVVAASVRQPDDHLEATLRATPVTRPFRVEQEVSLAGGWISWFAVPRLTLEGELRMGGQRRRMEAASAYHDHNWGRWRWGDDFGWEWGCFHAPPGGPSFVFNRTCDRAHTNFGEPLLSVSWDNQRRGFEGPGVVVEHMGSFPEWRPRRLPGALAALQQSRARPRLPAAFRIQAGDGFDQVRLEFTARAAAQLIVADPVVRGYGFIHEIAGTFEAWGRAGGADVSCRGLAIFEYVT